MFRFGSLSPYSCFTPALRASKARYAAGGGKGEDSVSLVATISQAISLEFAPNVVMSQILRRGQ